MEFFAQTDVGRKRDHNEDCYYATSKMSTSGKEIGIFVVADGVGGVDKGEVASFIACKSIGQRLMDEINDDAILSMDNREKVSVAIRDANKAIREEAQKTGISGGMGTTAVVALATDNQLLVANVGDSRAYNLLGHLRQVTKDHSLVQELVDAGQLAKDDMDKHPQRNVITRALGIRDVVEIDFFPYELKAEDPFILLCTDGLYSMVDPGPLLTEENLALRLDALCRSMIGSANDNGGSDNITAIMIRPARKDYETPRPRIMPRDTPSEPGPGTVIAGRIPSEEGAAPAEGTGHRPRPKTGVKGKALASVLVVVLLLLCGFGAYVLWKNSQHPSTHHFLQVIITDMSGKGINDYTIVYNKNNFTKGPTPILNLRIKNNFNVTIKLQYKVDLAFNDGNTTKLQGLSLFNNPTGTLTNSSPNNISIDYRVFSMLWNSRSNWTNGSLKIEFTNITPKYLKLPNLVIFPINISVKSPFEINGNSYNINYRVPDYYYSLKNRTNSTYKIVDVPKYPIKMNITCDRNKVFNLTIYDPSTKINRTKPDSIEYDFSDWIDLTLINSTSTIPTGKSVTITFRFTIHVHYGSIDRLVNGSFKFYYKIIN
jgi:protein phosphatase